MFHQFSPKKSLIQEEEMPGGMKDYNLNQTYNIVNGLNITEIGTDSILNIIRNVFKGNTSCDFSTDKNTVWNEANKSTDTQDKITRKRGILRTHLNELKNKGECSSKLKFTLKSVESKSGSSTTTSGTSDSSSARHFTSEPTLDDIQRIADLNKQLISKIEKEIQGIEANATYRTKKDTADGMKQKMLKIGIGIEKTEINDTLKTFKQAIDDIISHIETYKVQIDEYVEFSLKTFGSGSDKKLIKPYGNKLLDIYNYLINQVTSNIQKIKVELEIGKSSLSASTDATASSMPPSPTPAICDPTYTFSNLTREKINILDKSILDEQTYTKDHLEKLFSLKESDHETPGFYFDVSGAKQIKFENLSGINGYGFLMILQYYCSFMETSGLRKTGSSLSTEKFVFKNDIMPFIMKFKSGFDSKLNYTEYISNTKHKQQIAYMMIIHQAHYIGIIYKNYLYENDEQKTSVPPFNIAEGEETEITSDEILVKKYNYVSDLFKQLNKLKNTNNDKFYNVDATDTTTVKPSDILKTFDEYIRYVYKYFNISNWRTISFKYIEGDMQMNHKAIRANSLIKDETELTRPGVPAPPTNPAEEVEIQKELDKIIKEYPEFKESIAKMKSINVSLKDILRNVKTHYEMEKLKSSPDKIGKIEEELNARFMELQRSVSYYANKNGYSEIFNKVADEVTKKKIALNADHLDSIVRDVYKEIERIYTGLLESSKPEFTIKSNFEKNKREKDELLERIYAYKADTLSYKV